MYLRHLRIRNLKLLKDFDLSFTDEQGAPRMWTVIIGENGTGKTSILQAIALAAAGAPHVNGLIDNDTAPLRDKRDPQAPMRIQAEFGLSERHRGSRHYPGFSSSGKPHGEVMVESRVELPVDRQALIARSSYSHIGDRIAKLEMDTEDWVDPDPIVEARSRDAQLWFVAAYGIHRTLPRNAIRPPTLQLASIDRLKPLFQPVDLIGTAFADVLDQKAVYNRILKKALFGFDDLLPGFKDLELRGRGGVKSSRDLQEGHRFVQETPSGELRLPANWLSHGYQSTIAWIADLVGHILLEAGTEISPQEMEGLVLIDELDLYLHPRWQRNLIRALKVTFPRIQFVATTHSPLALVGLRPDEDEIVRLHIDEAGNVAQLDMKEGRPHEPDPRLMTGTEIYRAYFGIDELYPAEIGNLLREHRYLAADPTRSDADDARLDEIEDELASEGVEPDFSREPREEP
jgi:hypothetical protein